MKGLILAGGDGTRLRPLSHTLPKSLVPVANKPMIYWVVKSLYDAGIRDIGIVYKSREVIYAVREFKFIWEGANFTFISQHESLGIAHGIQVSRKFLGEDDFICCLGDNLTGEHLGMFVQFHRHSDDLSIMYKEVEDPRAFGLVAFDDYGHPSLFEEKPLRDPISNNALVGIYYFKPMVHIAIDNIKLSMRGQYEITDAMQWMVDRGAHGTGDEIESWWLDMGKKDSLLEANRRVLDVIKPKKNQWLAKMEKSFTKKPIALGGSIIDYSYIGPHVSIGHDCLIENSRITNSIILEGSLIRNANITGSIIGNDCNIYGDVAMDDMILSLGDNSEIKIK